MFILIKSIIFVYNLKTHTMKSLYQRLMKSNWNVEDFGRGKSKTSKARHKRSLKRKTISRLNKILEDKN